jgi:hypothetical protein
MRRHGRTTGIAIVLTLAASTATAQLPAGWALACGDGRLDDVIDGLESATAWAVCCTAHPSIPAPALTPSPGCSGQSLSIAYDLRNQAMDGQSWVVVQRFFATPKDLTPYTHLRVALRGVNLRSHETVEIKLKNDDNGIFTASLRSMTDLPVWRPIYLDFREFVRTGAVIDLTRITGLEVGIARCDACEVWDNPAIGEPEEHTGALLIDEIGVVDLKPGGAHRVVQTAFETVNPLPAVRAAAAAALRARGTASGAGQHLVPAWFPEANPNFNTYAQAEALLVFMYEYEHTGNVSFRNAANNLAGRLIALQIPEGRIQAGAWHTAHFPGGGGLVTPNRATTPLVRCNGDETIVADIDTCQWVGNVGWTLIALGKLRRSGIYTDAAALDAAIERGAAWTLRQPQERNLPGYAGLVSLGIEGNISGYLGLVASGKQDESGGVTLKNAIVTHGWDTAQRRFKAGARPEDAATAIDVTGSWGALFLRSIGRVDDALASQGYASSVLRAQSFDGAIDGHGDIAGPYTPAVEFAAQAAAAGITDANAVMQELAALQLSVGYPGAFPGAADHWYGGPLSPWVTTMAGVSPTAWMYMALCCNPLIAHVPFADEPLEVAATTTRAVHITELRTRIDALRSRFQLSRVSWTVIQAAAAGQPGTAITAGHINELRGAVESAYEAAGHAPPLRQWTDDITPGVTVKAVHITEIRDAVRALE